MVDEAGVPGGVSTGITPLAHGVFTDGRFFRSEASCIIVKISAVLVAPQGWRLGDDVEPGGVVAV